MYIYNMCGYIYIYRFVHDVKTLWHDPALKAQHRSHGAGPMAPRVSRVLRGWGLKTRFSLMRVIEEIEQMNKNMNEWI